MNNQEIEHSCLNRSMTPCPVSRSEPLPEGEARTYEKDPKTPWQRLTIIIPQPFPKGNYHHDSSNHTLEKGEYPDI